MPKLLTLLFPMRMFAIWVLALAMVALLFARPATSNVNDAQICAAAAHRASQQTGVPYPVLLAIAKTETGRAVAGKVTPWPWTINTRGEGKWLNTRAELQTLSSLNISQGITSFDVGCFQINYRWHGQNFTSLSEMLDPDANARYAARFLQELFQEFGNWRDAAGAYHSRTPIHAERYKKLFTKHYAAASPQPNPATLKPQIAKKRPNRFPLLQSGPAPIVPGSLVPAGASESAANLGSLVR